MEPVELETIMRSQTKDTMSGMNSGLETMKRQTAEQIAYIDKLEQQIALLQSRMSQTGSNIKATTEMLEGLSGAMSLGKGAASLMGVENEKLARIQTKLQTALEITNGIQQVSNVLNKESYFSHVLLQKGKDMLAAASTRLSVTLGVSNVAAKALMGTMTLGLSVAIGAVIALWEKYSSAQEEAKRKKQEAIEASQKQVQEEEQLRLSVAGSVASQMVEYQKLQSQYKSLGNDLKKKKEFIEENQDAFSSLGISVRSVSDAENLFVTNETVFLASLEHRAIAAAAMELAADKYKKAVEKMIQADGYKASNADKKDAEIVADQWLAGQAKKMNYKGNLKELATNDKYAGNKEQWVQQLRNEYQAQYQSALNAIKNSEKAIIENEANELTISAKSDISVGMKLSSSADEILSKANISKSGTTSKQKIPADNVENELDSFSLAAKKTIEDQKATLTEDGAKRRKLVAEKEYNDEITRIEKEEKRFTEFYNKLSGQERSANNEKIEKVKLDYDTQRENAKNIRDSKINKIDNDDAERQKVELDELLNKYRSYASQRSDITRSFTEDENKLIALRNVAETAAEREQLTESLRILEEKKNAAIKNLDDQQKSEIQKQLQTSALWVNIFSDASEKTSRQINGLLSQADALLNYLSGVEGAQAPEGLENLKLEGMQGNTELIKALKEAIKNLKREIKDDNPFISLTGSFTEMIDAFKKGDNQAAKNALDQMDDSFAKCINYLDKMGDGLTQVFGEDTGYAIDQALALAQSVYSVGSGIARIASGDILGGVQSVVSGIGSIFAMGKKVKEDNRKVQDELEKRNRNAYLAEFEVNTLYRERYEWTKKIGESTLENIKRQGEELKKQSSANQKEQDELWSKLMGTQYKESETYKHGTWFRKAKTITEWGNLADKSWEEIEVLAAAGKLSEEGMQYYEALKKAKEEGKDLADTQVGFLEMMRETFTGTSYSSFVSSIVDGFKEGKRTAADFADSFEELMKEAVLSSIQLMADEEAREFYEKWANLSGDGDGLTAKDKEQLKKEYEAMMERINQKGGELESIAGVSVTEETFTRTSYSSFVSSIVDGFKEGKRTAADFADSFEELMKEAVLSSIQLMADEEAREFYEKWANLSGDEDGLTAKDKEQLKKEYEAMMERINQKGGELESIAGVSVTEETFTGTSYSSFVSSIVDGFKEGKRSAADFADSFEELMKEAVLSSIQLMADEEAREFYEKWANLSGDEDGLTAKDKEQLKKEYEAMMERINQKGGELESIAGISVSDNTGTQQSANTGAFTTMSQEQGTKLEGLFTSVQDHVSGMDDKMTDISMVMYDSFDTLVRIADNTSYLKGMSEDINEMKRDGIKMK